LAPWAGSLVVAAGAPVPAGAPLRAVPQRGQNAKSGSHRAPHAGQGAGSFRPQRGQKAKSGDASKPQPAHAIVRNSLNRMFLDPHCSLGLRSALDSSDYHA